MHSQSLNDMLATELKLAIVGHVRHNTDEKDKASLSALSLVSQAWREPAQILLFEEIRICFDAPWDAGGFLETFGASIRLGRYVLKLVVWRGSKHSRGASRISVSQLLSITGLLPRLHTLSLSYCTITYDSDTVSHSDRSSSNSRRQSHPFDINFIGCGFTYEAFTSILGSFNIRSLCVVSSPPFDDSPGAQRLRFPSMRRLDLSMLRSDLLRQRAFSKKLLAGCNGLASLDLDISLEDADATYALYTFLRTEGRRLERLRLGLRSSRWHALNGKHAAKILDLSLTSFLISVVDADDGHGPIPEEWPEIPLADFCPSLRVLKVVVLLDHGRFDHQATYRSTYQWNWALRLLSSAPPTITHVTIVPCMLFRGNTLALAGSTAQYVHWRKWDETLGRLGCLQSVLFELSTESYTLSRFSSLTVHGRLSLDMTHAKEQFFPIFRQYVTEQLPAAQNRGILHFT